MPLQVRRLHAASNAGAAADGGKKKTAKGKKKIAKDGYDKVDKCKTKNIVTATKKGAAVLDKHIPDDIKKTYHVLQVDDEIYDATMNLTSVGGNNNKFYIIQALKSDAGGSYMVYSRWGRVGVRGYYKLQGPFLAPERAIFEFERKFHDKTGIHWSYRKRNQYCYANKYTWLEMDYGYNADKLPLGKLSRSTILKAYKPKSWFTHGLMLKEYLKSRGWGCYPDEAWPEGPVPPPLPVQLCLCGIPAMVKQSRKPRIAGRAYYVCRDKYDNECPCYFFPWIDGQDKYDPRIRLFPYDEKELKPYNEFRRWVPPPPNPARMTVEEKSEASCIRVKNPPLCHCGEFYSVIPHDFGFKKMSEFIIDTPQKLKAKLEMLEALSEIEIATKLLEDDSSDQDDPLYARYKQLCCDFTPLEADSDEYSMVSRLGEMERFQKFACAGNRMLLWHGSRLTNWTGILSQGLRIAPTEAPVTGYMFRKGVYFADVFTKSANYCHPSETCKSGVLLLCEVALGEMNELLNGDYNANNLPMGKLRSVSNAIILGSLLHNEYIVYNLDQIRMRYVLHVNFNFKRQ
uniref:Poly [ADP-ribose] polymerase n=1 Tax=Leersia perrieri TaxID=77586 RepID=A0A0D9V0P5_9ORYZ